MSRIYNALGKAIVEKPRFVLIACLLVLLVSFYGMSFVSMSSGNDTFVDPFSERGGLLNDYSTFFTSTTFLVNVQTDGIATPEIISFIARLEDEIRSVEHVTAVNGIVDIITAMNNGVLPQSPSEIRGLLERVPDQTRNALLPSGMMTLISVQTAPGLSDASSKALINSLFSIANTIDAPPGVVVSPAGNAAFEAEMEVAMGMDTGRLIGAAMFLMFLAISVLFSGVRFRYMPVGIVAAAIVITFGIMGLASIPISMVVIAAFPVMIGIGIDYSIQIQSRLHEEAMKMPIKEAAFETVTQVGPSVLIAMSSTMCGFIAMLITDVPMMRDFAIISAIGIFICYLTAIVVIPTLAILLNFKPKTDPGFLGRKMNAYEHGLAKLSHGIAKRPIFILVIFAVIAFVGFQMDLNIPVNTDQESFVPPDMPALVDLKKVERAMGSSSTMTVFVRSNNILSTDVIEWMDEFGAFQNDTKEIVTGVTSIATLLRQFNNGVLPSNDAEIQRIFALIPTDLSKRYIYGNMNAVIEFSMTSISSNVGKSYIEDMQSDLEYFIIPPPGVSASFTGQLEMFSFIIDQILQGKGVSVMGAILMITTFLLLVTRRIIAFAPIVPIFMIVGWNGIVMSAFNIEYTVLTAMLGSLTIGVASEFTIMIMERFNEERAKGLEKLEAIEHAVQKVGGAVTISGMVTVSGFAALVFSSFNIISNFGLVTVLTVSFSVLGAILVMPAMLSILDDIEHRNDKKT
jgi:hydrophobe/amphiphile efflux-3 (HAE3) family protein